MQFEDYYKVLGVSRTATQDQIQKAYRQKARRYHPDISKEPNAEERFKKVNEAYEVLKDPQSRQRYDALGANWKQGQDFRPPPGWQGFGSGDVNFGGQQQGFSDFFQVLFGQQQRRPASAPKQDAQIDIQVPLADVYNNVKRTVRVQVGHQQKSYRVTLPVGTTNGSLIRLAGQGPQHVMGGPRGDLRLRVEIAPHPTFDVDGHDLHVRLPLAPWEHALGARVSVPTMEGAVQMKIPPLMPDGRKLRVKHRGLTQADGTRGHLYVLPVIVNPTSLDEASRQLFEQLAQVCDFDPRARDE